MKTLTTLILISISFNIFALISPNSDRPLNEHLLEVNAEWSNHLSQDAVYLEAVNFRDENERISRHLLEVCDLIDERTKTYSTDKAEIRNTLMAQLRVYANTGKFPINTNDDHRIPYFIDVYGTACAVGHLMLSNGFEAEAMLVNEEINTAYIREIPNEWLSEWMNYSALTLDELALIQPSYPPNTVWENLDENISGTIYAMWDNGTDLIIAGDFTINGEAANIASFDGTELTAWPQALNGIAQDVLMFEDKIYVCGAFQGLQSDIAVWENEAWVYSNAVSGKTSEAYDLLVMDDELYCSTSYSGFVGYDYFVMKKNGSMWDTVGHFDEKIDCMYDIDGQLVAGGEFENLYDGGFIEMPYIAMYDGVDTWTSPGSGLEAPVYALAEIDGNLIAAGSIFDENNDPANFIRILIEDEWTEPSDFGFFQNEENYSVKDIHVHDGDYYFSGNYNLDTFGTFGADITKVHLLDDEMGGYYVSPDPLLAFAAQTIHRCMVWNGSLYIAGDFAAGLGGPAIFARTEIESSIQDILALELTIYPNPTAEFVTIDLPKEARNGSYSLLDVTGRTVEQGNLNGENYKVLDANSYRSGNYFIRVFNANGEQVAQGKIVVI